MCYFIFWPLINYINYFGIILADKIIDYWTRIFHNDCNNFSIVISLPHSNVHCHEINIYILIYTLVQYEIEDKLKQR